MALSAVDSIGPAFQHTKQQLLQPFRFGQWLRLAFVGLLAGEMSSGGGCNGGNFNFPTQHPSQGTQNFLDAGFGKMDPAVLGGLVILLILAGLILWVLLMWVSSVMRFILFDSVLKKNCSVRKGWNRWQGPGLRFFGWQLFYLLVMIMGLTILVGIPAAIGFAVGWLKNPSQHVAPLVLCGILLFFILFAFVLTMAVVHVMTKDFVVPQMALENLSAFEGWRRLWPQVRAEKGGYAGYVGMKIVMSLGAALVVTLISGMIILILLIPIGGVGALIYLLTRGGTLDWHNPGVITAAIVMGTVVIGFILYVIAMISVPVMVFFPAYSIYFFAPRYPALSQALYPPPPAPPPAPLAPDAPAVW